MDCSPPGKNTGVSSHFLPRPRAQTHASRIGGGGRGSSPLNHQGSPGSEFGVPRGQGMVRCCRMGSRAGACVSPGPSDMSLSAPSWARCSHRHDTLETGGSPAGSSQCGQGNRPARPQDGGVPLLHSMCSLWKGIETRQHGPRKRNDPPPGLPSTLPGAGTLCQLLSCLLAKT